MAQQRYPTIFHGAVAGIAGYLAVALLFALVNVIAGRSPFYTAAALGGVVVSGPDGGVVSVAPGPVLAYNAIHLVTFLVIGFLASWLVTWSEHGSPGAARWYLGLFLFLFVLFHLFAVAQGFARSVSDALPGGLIWGGGFLASAVMIVYLLGVHPALRRQLPADT